MLVFKFFKVHDSQISVNILVGKVRQDIFKRRKLNFFRLFDQSSNTIVLVHSANTNWLLHSKLFYVDNFYLLGLIHLQSNCLTDFDFITVLVVVILNGFDCHNLVFNSNLLYHNVQDFLSCQISHIVSAEVIYYPAEKATLVRQNHGYIR